MNSVETLRDQFLESMQEKGYVSLLTGSILLNPIVINGSSDYVEREFIAQCIRHNGQNPFNKEAMTIQALTHIPTAMHVVNEITDAINTFLDAHKTHPNYTQLIVAIRQEQFQPNSLLNLRPSHQAIAGPTEPTPDDLTAMFQAMGIDTDSIDLNALVDPAELLNHSVIIDWERGELPGLSLLLSSHPQHRQFFYEKMMESCNLTIASALVQHFPEMTRPILLELIHNQEIILDNDCDPDMLRKLVVIFPGYKEDIIVAVKESIRYWNLRRNSCMNIDDMLNGALAELFPNHVKEFIEIGITPKLIGHFVDMQEHHNLAALFQFFPNRSQEFIQCILDSPYVTGHDKVSALRELPELLAHNTDFMMHENALSYIDFMLNYIRSISIYKANVGDRDNIITDLARIAKAHPELKRHFYTRFLNKSRFKHVTKVIPKLIDLLPEDKEIFYDLATSENEFLKICKEDKLRQLIEIFPNRKDPIFEITKQHLKLDPANQQYNMEAIRHCRYLLKLFPTQMGALLRSAISDTIIAEAALKLPLAEFNFSALLKFLTAKEILDHVLRNSLLNEEEKMRAVKDFASLPKPIATNGTYEYIKDNEALHHLFHEERVLRGMLQFLSSENLPNFYQSMFDRPDALLEIMSRHDLAEMFVNRFPDKNDEIYEHAFKPNAMMVLQSWNEDEFIRLFPKHAIEIREGLVLAEAFRRNQTSRFGTMSLFRSLADHQSMRDSKLDKPSDNIKSYRCDL